MNPARIRSAVLAPVLAVIVAALLCAVALLVSGTRRSRRSA